MSDCDKSTNTCQTGSSTGQGDCKPGTQQDCCPIEMAVEKWSGAFCQAMTEVKVEILKAKIKKAWGSQMDQVGDAVVEAMGAEWGAMLTKAKARAGLRENIKKAFCSDKK
jgi:hypothetical protein